MFSAENLNDQIWSPAESFGVLSDAELFWRGRYHCLQSYGYLLRDRYHPDWVASWRRPGIAPPASFFKIEDALRLPPRRGHFIDATRISDSRLVYLKQVGRESDELALIHYLSADGRRDDPRNHCVPLLDVLPDPLDETKAFIVMPFLRSLDDPPFESVGELLDFGEQILQGLVFMHKHGVAHRDCAYQNVMMDGSALYPDGFHPVSPGFLRDLSGPSWPIPRSDSTGVKYYFTDFGISLYFPPDAEVRLAEGSDGLDQDPPELHQDSPYDPFKLDVFIIGNLLRTNFLNAYSNLGFLGALVNKMTQPDPNLRPTAEQVLEEWHTILRGVSFLARKWRLRKREDPMHVRLTMDLYGFVKAGFSGTNFRRYL